MHVMETPGPLQVAPGLCVAGMAVAQNREILQRAGVTHVVNCVGMLPPARPFADDLQYLVLHLLGARLGLGACRLRA